MNQLLSIYDIISNGYSVEYLDVLSIIALLFGIAVIINKNPIASLMSLIGLFASISVYLILTGLTFIGFSYLIVYIGAVCGAQALNIAGLVKIPLYKVHLILIKFFQRVVLKDNYFYISSSSPIFYSKLDKNRVKYYLNDYKFYSTLSHSDKKDEEFLKWFVGFSDGESNFTIVYQKDKKGNISGANFRFIIELHIDDLNTLNYIKSKLNIGNEVAVYGNSCKFTVTHRKEIQKLIFIFDKYNLNTSKYLDYLDFKKGFLLYYGNNEIDKRILIDQLLILKNGMNSNRIDFNFPSEYKIVICRYWLLGFIEAEGSFHLDRSKFQPIFNLSLTKVQLPVVEKIKEYLENNLGFDKYSIFKLKNSSAIAIIESKRKNNFKSEIKLKVSNTNILTKYFIPFLENMTFVTKKSKDFNDFKIISTAIYNGAYRNEEIKSLILKLSYTMNNYRLSSNSDSQKIYSLSKENLDTIINAKSTIIHLYDGRQLDNSTGKELNRRWTNCVYEIVKNSNGIKLASTLNEAAEILNVEFRTVRKHLDSLPLNGDFINIKGNKVRRVAVFYS